MQIQRGVSKDSSLTPSSSTLSTCCRSSRLSVPTCGPLDAEKEGLRPEETAYIQDDKIGRALARFYDPRASADSPRPMIGLRPRPPCLPYTSSTRTTMHVMSSDRGASRLPVHHRHPHRERRSHANPTLHPDRPAQQFREHLRAIRGRRPGRSGDRLSLRTTRRNTESSPCCRQSSCFLLCRAITQVSMIPTMIPVRTDDAQSTAP